jgi:hypothetical protein
MPGKQTGTAGDAIANLEKALIKAVKDGGKPLGIPEIQAVVAQFAGKSKGAGSKGAAPSAGFTQLLIAPFAEVIVEDPEIPREAIPRVMVNAYESAIDMLCGEETVFMCRGRCTALTGELEAESYTPSGLRTKVLKDASGFKVLTYLFSKLVMRFEDFEKRRDWMIKFVNEQLDEVEGPRPRVSRRDEQWKFGEDAFNRLFRAIFVDPATDTQNELMEKVYELVWNQHDAKGVKVATQFMRALGADHSHKH